MTKEIRNTNQNQSTALDFGSAQPAVSGYKKTKLGWIPKEWEVIKLNEVFDFISTNSFSRKELCYEPKENSVYNIHYGDIHSTFNEPILDYQKAASTIPVINHEIPLPNETAHLKNGDIVMADASEDYEGVGATIELSNFNDVKVVAGLHTFALRDKMNKTVEGFRTYVFKHPQVSKSIKVIATGSKVYGISKTNLAKIKLILPPLPEQQKIATILSTWDKCIALQTELIAAKEQQKKGLMQQLLSGEVRLRDENGKRFEGEWKEVKLGEVGKVKMCKRIFSHETSNSEEIPFYKIGTFGKNPDTFISKELFQEYKKKYSYPQQGEILISAAGTLGRTVVFDGKPSYFQDSNIVWLNHDESKVKNVYLYFVYQVIKYESEGGTIQRLYNDIIYNAKFLLPTIKEQQKIAAVLSAADREIALLKQELTALEQQKKGLMQVLLTGEVRVHQCKKYG